MPADKLYRKSNTSIATVPDKCPELLKL